MTFSKSETSVELPGTGSQTDCERYHSERNYFDKVAKSKVVTATDGRILRRYAACKHPHLFGKEMMFHLLGNAHGKRVLEVGCGEGEAAVQLAYCGARVTGIDISPFAISQARQRAACDGVDAEFEVVNLETDDLGESKYDVVWCDMILHHVVPKLDDVLGKLKRSLKKNGLFIAREPVAYAQWLKKIRRMTPIPLPETPDEQPLRYRELAIIESHFRSTDARYYRLLARIDTLTHRLPWVRFAGRIDNLLLAIPRMNSLAGDIVIWARHR